MKLSCKIRTECFIFRWKTQQIFSYFCTADVEKNNIWSLWTYLVTRFPPPGGLPLKVVPCIPIALMCCDVTSEYSTISSMFMYVRVPEGRQGEESRTAACLIVCWMPTIKLRAHKRACSTSFWHYDVIWLTVQWLSFQPRPFVVFFQNDSPGLSQRDGKRYAQKRVKGVALLKAMRTCQGGPGEDGKTGDHFSKALPEVTT